MRKRLSMCILVTLLSFTLTHALHAQNGAIVSKGARILGIDISESKGNDYDKDFSIARSAGAQIVTLSLAWDDIETAPNEYGNENLNIANIYYPAYNTPVALTIAVIDTNNNRMPSDLKNRPFNDPQVIARFKKLLDYLFSQIPDLKLISLAIGNEIDGYLGNEKVKWSQYTTFFKETSVYARSKRTNLEIGTKIMFSGVVDQTSETLAVNRYSDIAMVTYYPLNNDFTVKDPMVISDDFGELVSIFESKTVYMLEVGYPSSSICNSSEQKQAQAVREIFKAWDLFAPHIKLVNFVWLHDRPKSEIKYFSRYYGISDKAFISFLASLGLRTYEGKDKISFSVLRKESKARGWK